MISPLSSYWRESIAALDFAFQPIVNSHTGVSAGFEALLRGVERVGCPSIGSFFDRAFHYGVLPAVELALRRKAATAFARIAPHQGRRLFLNVDNRALTQTSPALIAEAIAAGGH